MVDHQIAESAPPETRETVERLLAEGYSPEHARQMIGLVLGYEITAELIDQAPFNLERFIGRLFVSRPSRSFSPRLGALGWLGGLLAEPL